MMTWDRASGTGAVVAAWGGFALAVTGWLSAAHIKSGEITIASLGQNQVMLSGNLIAILSSGFIHVVWSIFVDNEKFDFATINEKILLVENDMSGLTEKEQDKEELAKAHVWISRRGYILALILAVIWPALSLPAKVFSKNYFAFWVLLAVVWGFGSALIIIALPLMESSEDMGKVLKGMKDAWCGTPPEPEEVVVSEKVKDIDDDLKESA